VTLPSESVPLNSPKLLVPETLYENSIVSMPVTGAMVIIVIMAVGVAMPVVLVVPMAFFVTPAVCVAVVVWVRPVGARIGRLIVVARDPTIAMPVRHPETSNPNHANNGWRRGRRFNRDRWWRVDTDHDGYLRRCGSVRAAPSKSPTAQWIFISASA
jgi:hypothetical protein